MYTERKEITMQIVHVFRSIHHTTLSPSLRKRVYTYTGIYPGKIMLLNGSFLWYMKFLHFCRMFNLKSSSVFFHSFSLDSSYFIQKLSKANVNMCQF